MKIKISDIAIKLPLTLENRLKFLRYAFSLKRIAILKLVNPEVEYNLNPVF